MATARTIQKGRWSETIASVFVFVVCIFSAWAIASWWQTNETKSTPFAAPAIEEKSCDVYVLSVNVGDQPWVVLSNYQAEPKPDGTVEVKTTSQSDFQ